MIRRFQYDLGALFWLIAIFCVCLVFFPAMLNKLGQLGPQCIFPHPEPPPSLNATASEAEL